MDTTESETGKRKRVSGWLSIKGPEDVEKAITRTINKILASSDCINHAGKIASLANAWVNVRRLAIDAEEVRGIKDRTAVQAYQCLSPYSLDAFNYFKRNTGGAITPG